ncbi:MAG TPA: IS4 family transposase [Chitinophagaceae bacterium]|nr:IS4 family transposase [Chitinophagaceae bacterium]
MSKSTFFTGQPIFNQLLSLIPGNVVCRQASLAAADRYCKRFKTSDHLTTMLYAVFNRCTAIREVTTGLLAWEQRIHHVGLRHHPRRSTLSDANKRRSADVFGNIYFDLLQRYSCFLSDSRPKSKLSRLYIFDSTTITLFQEILQGVGRPNHSGKRKGGIKMHTLIRSDQDVPCLVRYSDASANDSKFLKDISLAKGSYIVFDRGYKDYRTFNRLTEQGVSWITRLRERTSVTVNEWLTVDPLHKKQGIITDCRVTLGHSYNQAAVKVAARIVTYQDNESGQTFEFLTNNQRISPVTIANYYRKRWQIELLFKRIKQNYPLQYFLGDNANAIKLQIWVVLIADLLLKVIKRQHNCKWSFSNLTCLIRLHLMTYIHLTDFIKSIEKSLLKKIKEAQSGSLHPNLFPT